ncbi:AraC-like DNA-binding protein [Leeuwenhoekiella aestuarii]|uniref:helix-turn-helix domain-containing protein n=1 Tax=Leeuwenhoekiella aestuarii TaxID=2249426 RepID=UPI000FFEE98A|nr:helix-turn-helix domain-containing protein [Leeuwenhoekiella aestuarii]RXG11478.1 AraC-like DNA-binding protein [Leeuwenhoekiella aestuarii]
MIKTYYFLFFFLFFFKTQSQQLANTEYLQLTDEELLNIYDNSQNKDLIECVSKIYLERAKNENDIVKVARGYDLLARLYDFKTNIKYADSIVQTTENLENNNNYPAMGYLLKGAYYYCLDDFQHSFDNYLKSQRYIHNDDLDKILTIRFGIAAIKDRWGMIDINYSLKTLKLIEEQSDYLKNYKIEYFNINQNIGYLYIESKDTLLAKQYFSKAKLVMNAQSDQDFLNLNTLAFAKLNLVTGHYKKALKQYQNIQFDNFDQGEVANYFINLGKVYQNLNAPNETVKNYIKVDSLYVNFDILPSNLPIVYSFLALKAAENQDSKKHLYYTQKLIEVNNKISDNVKILNLKFYNSEILDLFYVRSNKTFFQRKIWLYFLGFISLGGLILILVFKNKKSVNIYLSRTYVSSFLIDYTKTHDFDESSVVEDENQSQIDGEKKHIQINNIGVSQQVINDILVGLESFEKEKIYLKIGRLKDVSDYIHTNSSYLSKVVNFYKQKSFSVYIHELRINEAVFQLKTNALLQSYTIEAVSKEFGYNSAESFSKAFKKIVGIYPSKFIKDTEQVS